MDLKELDYIVTVANEGSISRAAEKLFMAQSSLSQAVRLFEQDLGTPIFVRTARGVRPTSAGEAFIFHARQILQQYQEARSEASDIENLKGGTVIFGISTYRGTYLLPPVLKKFHALYPRVHVEICEMDSIEQMWIDLKDTAPFEYILGPPSTVLGRTGRRSLREAGVEPLGLDTYLSASFAAAMAREGVGLAFTYRSCRIMRDEFRYLRIGKDGIFLDLALAWPAGKYRSRAAMALAKLFQEMAPELLRR